MGLRKIHKIIGCVMVWIALAAVCVAGVIPTTAVAVDITAKPSPECFLPSSLEQKELEETFARICPSCLAADGSREAARFEIVVEDPGLVWRISVFDPSGRLLETRESSGSLERALTGAAERIVKESQNVQLRKRPSEEIEARMPAMRADWKLGLIDN